MSRRIDARSARACLEAAKRGANSVLGIDYCTSPDLTVNGERATFSLLQLDVSSERLLELPEFDAVHCVGVLDHVESSLSLLFRLRKLGKLDGLVHFEMTYRVGRPNEPCLREMLSTVGFADIEITYRLEPEGPAAEPSRLVRVAARLSMRCDRPRPHRVS